MTHNTTDAWIGWTLLAGLVISIGVMLGGLASVAATGASASSVVRLANLIGHLTSGDASAVLDLGILILFAAPVVGVAVAFVRFLAERDMVFAAVAAALLAVLAVGFGVALH